MATFNDADVGTSTGGTTPVYGVQKTSKPKTKIVQYADGYEQRIVFGLAQHQNPKTYRLAFKVSEADADKIETFLDARANDSASFDWTPPSESSAGKYVCPGWNKSLPYLNRATITATFREVFEP